MPTIYEIAKKAGVSPSTVSKVFHNYSDVSQKTKEKVMQVVESMGYVPNLTAQSLKTNKSYLVGVMFSERIGIGIENNYYSTVLESFRKAMGSHGYDTVFINKTLGDNEMGYLEHCKYRNIDGILIITAQPDDMDIDKLRANNIKCVTTDIHYKNTPYITSDNISGSRMAVKYLYDMGHRRIAHISGPRSVMSFDERYHGYVQGLKDIGSEFDKSYYVEVETFSNQLAYESTQHFLSRFSKNNRPTAIYAGLDIIAIEAIKAIGSLGLKVPEDISIIGFDDVKMSRYVTPALTTVAQNTELIGTTIANTLYGLISRDEFEQDVAPIPVRIVERASVMKIDV